MKQLFAAGAVAAALFSAPAFAADAVRPAVAVPPQVVAATPLAEGYIELYGMGGWNDPYWTPSATYDPWKGGGGAARLNIWMSPTMSSQFDFAGQAACSPYAADPYYYCSVALHGALHLSRRSTSGLLGAFGGLAANNDDYGEYGLDYSGFVGAEAQHYMGPVTLYGQIGYDSQFSGYYHGAAGFNYLFAQGEVRFFLTPNTELSANVGLVNGRVFGTTYGPARTYLNYGAEIEQKFANPLSVFARAEFDSAPSTATYPGTSYQLEGGIKIHWDAMTLLDQDRKGATLKVMQDLAPFSWLRLNNEY